MPTLGSQNSWFHLTPYAEQYENRSSVHISKTKQLQDFCRSHPPLLEASFITCSIMFEDWKKVFFKISYLQHLQILTLETTRKMVYRNIRLCLAIGKYWLCCRVKRTAPIKVTFTGLQIKQTMLISPSYTTLTNFMAWKTNILSMHNNYF